MKKKEEPELPKNWAVKKGEGVAPLIGRNWRTELVAYALQIFFVYIDDDGFAHLNLSNTVSSRITTILCKDLEKEEKAAFRSSNNSITPMSTPSSPSQQQRAFEDDEVIDIENPGSKNKKSILMGKSRSRSNSENQEDTFTGLNKDVLRIASKIAKAVEPEQLPNLFTDAQEEIFNLMQSDSFRRYVRSHLYREWREKEEEEDKRQKVLKQTMIV